MKKVIWLGVLLMISSVYAIDLNTSVGFNPSQSNILFTINLTSYGFTEVRVNETCVTFNNTLTFCNLTTGVEWLTTTYLIYVPPTSISCSNLTVEYNNPYTPKVIQVRCRQ